MACDWPIFPAVNLIPDVTPLPKLASACCVAAFDLTPELRSLPMTLRTPCRRLVNLNLGSLRPRNQPFLLRTTTSRHTTRLLSNTRSLKMSNDDDYMAFLNKANQDTGAGAATQGKTTFKTKDQGAQVPKPISDVCKNAVYTSDADEPFEEVSLKWEGKNGLPSESKKYTPINEDDKLTCS
jgi:hypothetical protein